MRCKNCHYSLANLTKHRCPECGRPFDPNDASTMDAETHSEAIMRRSAWGLMSVAFLALAVHMFLESDYESLAVRAILAIFGAAMIGSICSPVILLPLLVISLVANRKH